MTKAKKDIVAVLKEQVAAVKNHDELKKIGAEIVNAELSNEQRTEVVKAYRAKRNELDRKMVQFSKNSNLKKMLYNINTMTKDTMAAVGKTIYDLANMEGIFNKYEADLCFRSYNHQKNKFARQIAA